jgi:hypothetical protein
LNARGIAEFKGFTSQLPLSEGSRAETFWKNDLLLLLLGIGLIIGVVIVLVGIVVLFSLFLVDPKRTRVVAGSLFRWALVRG